MSNYGANGLGSGKENASPQFDPNDVNFNSLCFGRYMLTVGGPTYGLVAEVKKKSNSTPHSSPTKGDPNGCEQKSDLRERLRTNRFELEIAARTQLTPDDYQSSEKAPATTPKEPPVSDSTKIDSCVRRLVL